MAPLCLSETSKLNEMQHEALSHYVTLSVLKLFLTFLSSLNFAKKYLHNWMCLEELNTIVVSFMCYFYSVKCY